MIREAGITRIELCGFHPPTHYDYHDLADFVQAYLLHAEALEQCAASHPEQGHGASYGAQIGYLCKWLVINQSRRPARQSVILVTIIVFPYSSFSS